MWHYLSSNHFFFFGLAYLTQKSKQVETPHLLPLSPFPTSTHKSGYYGLLLIPPCVPHLSLRGLNQIAKVNIPNLYLSHLLCL